MDNSLGEYPKLVDTLSESLETVQGGELKLNSWETPYTGYLCRYSSHAPLHRGWGVISGGDTFEIRREKHIWHDKMLKLARQHWVGWNTYQKFENIIVSVNVFDGG